MSQSIPVPELAALLYELYTQGYIQYSLIALVAHEYLITFHQEISTFWTKSITGASILFFMNRYLMIMYSVVSPLSEIVFALFSALRVYALWNRNIVLFMLIMALLLVPVATGIYYFTTTVAEYLGPPLSTCGIATSLSTAALKRYDLKKWYAMLALTHVSVTRATRIPVIIADALVLVLTWMKTFTHKREATRLAMRVPLSTMLLRDGTGYFVVLLAMNIAQMILANDNIGYMDPFLNLLTPILVSRFMLNLRQIDAVSEYSSSTGPTWSRFSAVDFHVRSSIIGNLGELLDHDSTNDPTAASTSDQSQATDSSTAYTNANTQDASPSKSDDIQEVLREAQP